jgi:iron complex transport system ATP-binding protein
MAAEVALLRLCGLEVHRGGTRILRGIDWTVRAGEHWVILGPNGSGKTSLLTALTGYLTPSGGQIEVLGQTYGESDWRELRQRVGLVSSSLRQQIQDEAVTREIVAAGRTAILNPWKTPSAQDFAEADRWMRKLKITALRNREWGVLSQGERQRVLIARALHADPELLILDEPCAGLDPAAREDFLEFMESLAARKSGPALVLVTHHVEEITTGFTHALLLKTGRVEASGRIEELFTSARFQVLFGIGFRLLRRRQEKGFRFELRRNSKQERLES